MKAQLIEGVCRSRGKVSRLRSYPEKGHRSVCRPCEAAARRARYASSSEIRIYHLSQASSSRRKKRGEPGGLNLAEIKTVSARPACESCQHPNDGDVPMTVDHAQPVSPGGDDDLGNLRLACKPSYAD